MMKLIPDLKVRIKKIEEIYMSIIKKEHSRKDLIKCGCPECTYLITLLDS